MLSKLPTELSKVPKNKIDQEILRAGIIAELDAVNFYEQMAEMAENEKVKEILMDITREEKTHVGEFETMLLNLDQEQVQGSQKGREEVEKMLE